METKTASRILDSQELSNIVGGKMGASMKFLVGKLVNLGAKLIDKLVKELSK